MSTTNALFTVDVTQSLKRAIDCNSKEATAEKSIILGDKLIFVF